MLFHALLVSAALSIVTAAEVHAGGSNYAPGSTGFWPTLSVQCTAANRVLTTLNVTAVTSLTAPNRKGFSSCCFNATEKDLVGSFPTEGSFEKGSFIGCSLDGYGRPIVSTIQVNQDAACHASAWPSLTGLPSLHALIISTCSMPGVQIQWTDLYHQTPFLSILSLKNSNLVGSLPDAFGSLANLRVLDLSTNFLTGSIPSRIGALKELTILSFASNMMSGFMPDELNNLTAMENMDLSMNSFYGAVPRLDALTQLKTCLLPAQVCIVEGDPLVPSVCKTRISPWCATVGSPSGVFVGPKIPYRNSTVTPDTPPSHSTAFSIGLGVGLAVVLIALIAGGLVYLQKQSLKSGNWEKHRRWFQFDEKEAGKSAASPVRVEAVPPASTGPIIVDVSPWNEV